MTIAFANKAPTSDGVPSWSGRYAPPAVATMVAVVLWWFATSVLSAPESVLRQTAPQHVFPALAGLLERGVLLGDLGVSLWRLLIGLAVAAVIGMPLGLLIGSSGVAERAGGPIIAFLRMISPLSWTPIALAVFGIGNQPVIFLIAVAAVWPVLLNTAAGVRVVDPGLLNVARSFHATRWELLLAVILPAIRTHVQTGIRLALGVAWIVLVAAEMLGVRSGLGYQILNARDQLAYDQVVAVIVVIGLLGFLLDAAARWLLNPARRGRG
ncbi:ABC transporter permease [Mycolicibacterium fortuitum]|uniref:ABC transporter permease n=1 Tax=Mycolicibacterium fortuitum TaxID=1766 RepID=UPI0007EBD4F8|nr:ABC transporter permease [Mycolicibacterium fortuitum]OBG14080.1 ABC transporter permease [Mycolicibacterium fortuitum]